MPDDLTDFLARYERDDNEWWRLGSGEHLNLFDAAIERAEQAEAELARLRRQIVDDEVDLDDVMASLHQPTEEARCGRCGGTRIEPGSEDHDAVAHRDNPYTGEPCSACQQGAALTPPRRLTEQQGGIPNDAITPDDMRRYRPTDPKKTS